MDPTTMSSTPRAARAVSDGRTGDQLGSTAGRRQDRTGTKLEAPTTTKKWSGPLREPGQERQREHIQQPLEKRG